MARKMKDSGIEWVGRIPKDWKLEELKRTCNFHVGFTPSTKKDEFYAVSGSENAFKWVTIADMQGKYIIDTKKYVTIAAIKERKQSIMNKNSLIFSFKLSIGQVAFLSDDMYTNEAIATFQKDENENDLGYLYYMLPYFVPENANTNIYEAKLLNQELINNALVLLPPLKEQQIITNYLDKKVSRIDSIIEDTRLSIDEFKKYKQNLIIETVTKGLNSNVKVKESGVNWIGSIPKGWHCLKIKYVTSISRGKFNHRPRNDERYYDGEYPFIQTGDVARASKYITSYSQTLNELGKEVSKEFPKGTLVMTIAANIGDVAVLDFDSYFPDSVIGFVPNDGVYWNYLYYIFCAMKETFINTAIVSTQLNLNVERVKELLIPITNNEDEQQQIASYLDEKCTHIDSLIGQKKDIIKEFENYKKSLIYEYVTGMKEVL